MPCTRSAGRWRTCRGRTRSPSSSVSTSAAPRRCASRSRPSRNGSASPGSRHTATWRRPEPDAEPVEPIIMDTANPASGADAPRSAPALIALGETMVLITPHDATRLADADDVRLTIGGAESNVAAHVASLGHRTAWVSALGDDVLGHRVHRTVTSQGVDTRWVSFDPDAPTGVYFKDPGHGVHYYRAGSAASRMTPESVADVPLEDARIVHVSGITPALSACCAAMMDAVIDRVTTAGRGSLSFDANHRAALWPASVAAPVLLDLANRSDIVFVGLDEAETLWGCRTP